MAGKSLKKYPAVKGLSWHSNQFYSFFTPADWHGFHWADARQGEAYGPDLDDPSTVFAVDVKELGTPITVTDLEILAEGFFTSITQLPESNIETQNQKVIGSKLELEAQYTFYEQGQIRKCWVRAFYLGTYQIVLAAQGATPEKYDYWLPWFFEAMSTAKVHTHKPKSPFGV